MQQNLANVNDNARITFRPEVEGRHNTDSRVDRRTTFNIANALAVR